MQDLEMMGATELSTASPVVAAGGEAAAERVA